MPDPYFERSSSKITVSHVRRGPALRELQLAGDLNCKLTYNGRGIGYESVLIDGHEVARVVGHEPAYTTPIEFKYHREGDRERWFRIDIETKLIYFITAFEVRIDRKLVFEERWYRTLSPLGR